MKIIHLSGFSEEERNSYKSIIFNNTVGSMRVLVTAATELGVELRPENEVSLLSEHACLRPAGCCQKDLC